MEEHARDHHPSADHAQVARAHPKRYEEAGIERYLGAGQDYRGCPRRCFPRIRVDLFCINKALLLQYHSRSELKHMPINSQIRASMSERANHSR